MHVWDLARSYVNLTIMHEIHSQERLEILILVQHLLSAFYGMVSVGLKRSRSECGPSYDGMVLQWLWCKQGLNGAFTL